MNRFDGKSRTLYLDQFYGTKAYYIPNSHRQWQKKYEPAHNPTYYYDYYSNQTPTNQQLRRGSVHTEQTTFNKNMQSRRASSIYG